jgi:hypothetical protein
MFPLCRCYAYQHGKVTPYTQIQGHWRSLAHSCEQHECAWPKCQQFGGCPSVAPPDDFKHCEKQPPR